MSKEVWGKAKYFISCWLCIKEHKDWPEYSVSPSNANKMLLWEDSREDVGGEEASAEKHKPYESSLQLFIFTDIKFSSASVNALISFPSSHSLDAFNICLLLHYEWFRSWGIPHILNDCWWIINSRYMETRPFLFTIRPFLLSCPAAIRGGKTWGN